MFDLFDVKIPYVANSWNFVTARLKFIMASRANPNVDNIFKIAIESDHEERVILMIGF